MKVLLTVVSGKVVHGQPFLSSAKEGKPREVDPAGIRKEPQ